jgi:hypothetical protein
MKYLLSVCLSLFALSSFAQQTTTINDKNAEVRSVTSFIAIKVSGAIDVYLSQGNEEALAVSASEEKYRDLIVTQVDNGVLKISFNGDRKTWNVGNKKLKAYVSFKQLKSLDASGASSLKITDVLNATSLNVKLTGACDMSGELVGDDVSIDINGASTVKLTGNVKNLDVSASGASDLKGYDLKVNDCTAKASGASDISITVNQNLSASASGASSIHYKGEGTVKEVRTSGASSVSKRG